MADVQRALDTLTGRAAALDIALHTVQVTVGREPVLTAECAPMGIDTPQRMFSVSKSFTALAIGLLAEEGRLGLDDPIVSHFPEMVPETDLGTGQVHPWLAATTIRHMLAMRGPHRSTTYKIFEGGWLESYFRVPPTHPPGTLFTYDTSAAYTLAALVERLAGTSVADYLRPRVLDPIGVDPRLRFLTGPEGISHGGSGLICTARDLLRLTHLMLDGGTREGRALLPPDFLAQATSVQSNPATQTWGASLRSGYGYQIWLPGGESWAMFGMGGQIVYGDPARDLALVVTADAQACASGDQRLLDLLLDGVLDDLVDGRPEADARSVELSWPAPGHDAAHAREISGRYRNASPGAGPDELVLELTGDGGRLRTSDGWDVPLTFGTPVRTVLGGDPGVVTAGWSFPGCLDVRVGLHGDELRTLRIRCSVADDGTLAVHSQAFGETADPAWSFHAGFAPEPPR